MNPEQQDEHESAAMLQLALVLPFAFTQSPPLGTTAIVGEARQRGLVLVPQVLRQLYRHGDLVPLVEVTDRRVRASVPVLESSRAFSTLPAALFRGLAEGRVRYPAAGPYRPRLRFGTRTSADPRRWWNGLIYSRWQLLAVPELRGRVRQARQVGTGSRHRIVLPPPSDGIAAELVRIARWIPVLIALEARYLPTVDEEWIQLTNAEFTEWEEFRIGYDPTDIAQRLGITADEALAFAERLLSRARTIDPTGDWSQLIRRAPRDAWKTLTGDALVALDHRVAAEVLLLFCEDLAERGNASPLPTLSRNAWHPLVERISYRQEEHLDRVLSHLGVSPHPGVILVVEGQTEQILVRHVFEHLALPHTPDRVQVLCMGGGDNKLGLVAAATAAPLIGQQQGNTYDLIRPPTRLLIAVDPDKNWNSAAKVKAQREKILSAIDQVVQAQGASIESGDLESLVVIETWNASCFEFAHFTDEELADGIRRVHTTCNGLGRTSLVARIAEVRHEGGDIKGVWKGWAYEPAKPKLAEALWPTLRDGIDDARWSETKPMPQIAEVVWSAYELARQRPSGTYVLDSPTS